MDEKRSKQIAVLNDAFRKQSQYMLTPAVLNHPKLGTIMANVKFFSDFTVDNDFWSEHDFGSFRVDNDTFFWKIDYYDEELKYGTDPLDPKCKRVLTVLLSSEY